MQVYICEICGDAYIGKEKPTECPFCGAEASYIKKGSDARPVFRREGELSEETKKYLVETYELEVNATKLYNCIAQKTKNYEVQAMYKRLAKVELEHAVIASKFLERERPQIEEGECFQSEKDNFQKTIILEDHATKLYRGFAQKVKEEKIKIFFTALAQVEAGHIELVNNYVE